MTWKITICPPTSHVITILEEKHAYSLGLTCILIQRSTFLYREDFPSHYWKLLYYCSMYLQVTICKSLLLFKFIGLDLTTHTPRMEFVICCDMNVNFLIDSNFKLQISVLLLSYYIFHIVDFTSIINENAGSAIDNILSIIVGLILLRCHH